MANLTIGEEIFLEELLEMGSGYVLDFSDSSFRRFVFKSTGINLFDENNDVYYGLSKAKKLRAFWLNESNFNVATLLAELREYWMIRHTGSSGLSQGDVERAEKWEKTIHRLKNESPVENLEAIDSLPVDEDLSSIATAIRLSVNRNEPEAALDRLHTFVTKFIRSLCDKRELHYDKNTPLHGLFGSYVKFLRTNGKFETMMTEQIFVSFIKILESFNKVRSDHSFAHPNPLLNYPESLLIVNNVLSIVKLIQSMELAEESKNQENLQGTLDDDIPF